MQLLKIINYSWVKLISELIEWNEKMLFYPKLKKFYNDEKFSASMIYGECNDYSDFMPIIKKYDLDCEKILDFRDLLVLLTKK